MRALSVAATGMVAQQTNVEVIANNIANANTVAFKRSRAEFADLLYQSERAAGVPNRSDADPIPEASQIGLGVQPVAIRSLHTQGPLTKTGNSLDLALSGRGWFQITGANNETLYTRAGTFSKNATGQLVTQDGYTVIPSITIPTNATSIQVNTDGTVYVDPGTGVMTQVGQLTIANFANEAGLEALGNNLFRETLSSGSAQVQVPGSEGYATVQQYYVESSNVDPVQEITNLISAQRNYEMNSKVIQAADEMFQVLTKNNL
ncbi:flagellar basal-body rod protein FlgG [Rhodomicrobium lacus]|jgi:flagellar basal-body rod protein FlgG|uniref:flagellar basal-body rod protein FlgG n=1 Tax=Rhodomicrobium lacus TaxID=2498452 RepID=UPI0026E18636|nr:flagellar basal-body rod protein FlgG [Rhodomicrobium lacus]WKW50674.1 flagellar basal-body rod protein FlgG [Rhodomicrobium lacus]